MVLSLGHLFCRNKLATVNDESLVGLKFGKFGESQAIHQTKIIQTLCYVIIIINSQCHSPNFPSPNLLRTEFTKLSPRQTFIVYSIH